MVKGSRRVPGIALIGLMVVGLVLAACGGGDTTNTSDESGDTAYDPNGVLRMAFDIQQGGGLSFDPTYRSPGFYVQQEYVYDTLLHEEADGTVTPGLAESATIIDTRTLEVKLRSNLKFSDGTPLDSAALKFGMMRNATSKSVGFRPEVFEIADVQIIDSTTSRLLLKTDVAGAVYSMMAWPETYLVSPTAVNAGQSMATNPVGAGAFTVTQFVPGQSVTFKKNPNYYDAANIKLAGMELTHVGLGTPGQLNGLLGGQFDVAQLDSLRQVPGAVGPNIQTEVKTGNSYGMIYWCKSKPPLNDVRVRQALSFATDRDAIIATAQSGYGEPAWGLWPEGHPFYSPDLEGVYAYDVSKAKDLLAKAGYANGFSIDSFFTPSSQQTGEILQAQWAKVGVKLNLVVTNDYVLDFMTNAKAPMWISGWSGAGNRRITRLYGPGQLPNVCQYNDPELNAMSDELKKIDPTTEAGVQIWKDMQDIVVGDVLSLNLAFQPIAISWDTSKVGGVEIMENPSASMGIDPRTMYMKADS